MKTKIESVRASYLGLQVIHWFKYIEYKSEDYRFLKFHYSEPDKIDFAIYKNQKNEKILHVINN